jgi:hypothetical protein
MITDEQVEKLAADCYYACCAARSKDGKNPFEVGCKWNDLFDEPKEFYRNVARWHLRVMSQVKP